MPTKELIRKEIVRETALHSVHLIADFISPQHFVEEPEELETILYEAAYVAKNTPLKSCIHKFPGQGITGVLVLAESHIAIHTWPEHDYIAVDLFTCGRHTQPHKALEYLKRKFLPAKVRVRDIDRGLYE
ncbi:MAG: adenosylmethionine decarboxylase [Candidatus Omnitrophica bacterium]|nr:adenosylmethionine decarboxylase [Candidatus Omnitrophota bacterium]